MKAVYNKIAAGDVGRIAALSDGVFAFAATVLVLDVHTPDSGSIHSEADLIHALGGVSPSLATWLLSLMTLGIFWVGQQTQLNQLARADLAVTWRHFAFLAVITVLPFTTRLLADFFAYHTAHLIYWANILFAGVTLYATWGYSERAGLVRDPSAEVSKAIRRRIVVAQALYGLGALASLVRVEVGFALILLIQFNYAIAPRVKWLSWS